MKTLEAFHGAGIVEVVEVQRRLRAPADLDSAGWYARSEAQPATVPIARTSPAQTPSSRLPMRLLSTRNPSSLAGTVTTSILRVPIFPDCPSSAGDSRIEIQPQKGNRPPFTLEQRKHLIGVGSFPPTTRYSCRQKDEPGQKGKPAMNRTELLRLLLNQAQFNGFEFRRWFQTHIQSVGRELNRLSPSWRPRAATTRCSFPTILRGVSGEPVRASASWFRPSPIHVSIAAAKYDGHAEAVHPAYHQARCVEVSSAPDGSERRSHRVSRRFLPACRDALDRSCCTCCSSVIGR